MRRRCRRQIDTFWAERGLAITLPASPSTSAVAPAIATTAPIRSMTMGCALAASEKIFVCVFARVVACFVTAVLVRVNQIQSVAKSFTFGVAPLQARWLLAWSVWIDARMGFVACSVVPTCGGAIAVICREILAVDQHSALVHCRKRSASLLIVVMIPTVEVVHD